MNIMSIQCCNVHISLLPDKPFSVEPPKGMYYIGSILSMYPVQDLVLKSFSLTSYKLL